MLNEPELRNLIRVEVARLKNGEISPQDISDKEPLFSLPDNGEASRIDLDSLDALELAYSIEQATGIQQPIDADYTQLLTIDHIVRFVSTLFAANP